MKTPLHLAVTEARSGSGITLTADLQRIFTVPSYVVTLTSSYVPVDSLREQHLIEFVEQRSFLLASRPYLKVGVYKMEPTADFPNHVSIDLNISILNPELREEAVSLGVLLNQQSIWDGYNQQTIPTGGAGIPVLNSVEDIAQFLSGVDKLLNVGVLQYTKGGLNIDKAA